MGDLQATSSNAIYLEKGRNTSALYKVVDVMSHETDVRFQDDGSEIADDEDDGNDVERSNLSNPIIFKNFMYRRIGSLPFLLRAVVESLEAASDE